MTCRQQVFSGPSAPGILSDELPIKRHPITCPCHTNIDPTGLRAADSRFRTQSSFRQRSEPPGQTPAGSFLSRPYGLKASCRTLHAHDQDIGISPSKTANAQVRCAMFRNTNMRVRFQPDEGPTGTDSCQSQPV